MSERVVVQNASYGGEECKGLAFKKDPCNKTPCPGKFFINLNFYYLFTLDPFQLYEINLNCRNRNVKYL